MLFIILLYYLALYIRANPIPPISSRSFESNSCIDLTYSRTIWNIIWSCLVTIFSCTWVVVHPNMPCPKKREAKNCFQWWIRNPLLSFAEHHLPLFVCALLVPEYMPAWAIRQHLSARKIANKINVSSIVFALHNHFKSLIGRHWSRTHGFFIVMGGFHLFKRVPEEQNDSQSISQENDDLLHPLLAVDLVRDDFYSFTMLTEAKIKDRTKSDWLARLAFG